MSVTMPQHAMPEHIPQVGPYRISYAPGFVQIIHLEESAESMEQRFLDYAQRLLRINLERRENSLPRGSQFRGDYDGYKRTLFKTARDEIDALVFDENENVIYKVGSRLIVTSHLPIRELEKLVESFGKDMLKQAHQSSGPQ
ncbi:hypothetical protein HYS31_05120 [Candidatus Woesearchaeota archaeon]|nr:hypothetical protein [Candidatus Woesearchaeota archaeon]